jgi:hypothetical protein
LGGGGKMGDFVHADLPQSAGKFNMANSSERSIAAASNARAASSD